MELNAHELRIGNLFQEQKTKEIIMVTELSIDKIGFSGLFEKGWQAEPIILTEEFLIKLGFVKKDEGYGILTSMKQAVLISFGNHNCAINGLSFNNPIKYVHQLQNLFFALIGEELELK